MNVRIPGSSTGGSGISDAPSDGTTYGRKDGSWVGVTGGASYDEVATHADLPVTIGTPAVGTLNYVQQSTGSYLLFTKKPSGFWRRVADTGVLADDWERAGDLDDLLPAVVSQATAEAGTDTSVWSFTVQRVAQMIAALGFSGSWNDLADKPATFAPSTHASDHVTGGSDVIPNAVAGGNAGLMSGADKTKLDGIAAGATVNSTDAQLRDRSTHTGTQAISTVTGLQTALDAKVETSALAAVATSGAYNDLTGKPTLGTAAALDVPAAGDAASGQVVKGSDTRLTDARAPTAHTHPQSDVTNLTTDLAAKAATSTSISTQHSLTGGGDLSATRTLSLVNDTASPGANKVYGTDASGVRGWKNDPAGGPGGWTSGLITSTVSSFSNSTTETSVMTCTIPGDTLGTAGAVRCVLFGQWTNNSGANATLTVKVRYGGTTIYHDSSNSATTHGNPRPFTIAFILAANGATGSQRLLGEHLALGPVQAVTTGYGSWSSGSLSLSGGFGNTSISVDSTTDQTLEILITMSSATNTTFTALRAPVVKL